MKRVELHTDSRVFVLWAVDIWNPQEYLPLVVQGIWTCRAERKKQLIEMLEAVVSSRNATLASVMHFVNRSGMFEEGDYRLKKGRGYTNMQVVSLSMRHAAMGFLLSQFEKAEDLHRRGIEFGMSYQSQPLSPELLTNNKRAWDDRVSRDQFAKNGYYSLSDSMISFRRKFNEALRGAFDNPNSFYGGGGAHYSPNTYLLNVFSNFDKNCFIDGNQNESPDFFTKDPKSRIPFAVRNRGGWYPYGCYGVDERVPRIEACRTIMRQCTCLPWSFCIDLTDNADLPEVKADLDRYVELANKIGDAEGYYMKGSMSKLEYSWLGGPDSKKWQIIITMYKHYYLNENLEYRPIYSNAIITDEAYEYFKNNEI